MHKGFRSETRDPKGSKNKQIHEGVSPQTKKRSSDLFAARVGLLYFVQDIVHVTSGHGPLEIEECAAGRAGANKMARKPPVPPME
jgi:hypothetical protein